MSHSKTMESSASAVSPGGWVAETEAERDAIRAQMGLVVASPLFSHSKRFPNFLRYTVECALKGEVGHLKERTIGVEVFGRDPNYDTNLDPVVRMTAVEIRKRLAQYYKSPGRESEIRIDLPAGSYIPEFHPPVHIELPKAEAVPRPRTVPWLDRLAIRLPGAVVAGIICCLLLALLLARPWIGTTALDRFWGPVLASPSPLLLCIAGLPARAQPNAGKTQAANTQAANTDAGALTYGQLLRRNRTPFSDALALSAITGYLGSRGKKYRVRLTGDTALDDLRDGPAVLIGAYNNDWTMRLLSQARFSFAVEGDSHYIRDRNNPGLRKWKLETGLGALVSSLPEDYALISRVLDPTTGRLVVVAAGIMAHGTRAAGEFLSEPGYMAQAEKLAPGDWKRKNIQVVIATRVIGENAGSPRVLAAYIW
jgi:hypothetical protein